MSHSASDHSPDTPRRGASAFPERKADSIVGLTNGPGDRSSIVG
jgi:hypothetical protein